MRDNTRLSELSDRYREFVRDRDWERFHTPQNLAQAISVEANELVENFLWIDNPPSEAIRNNPDLVEDIRDEMADVLIYLIGLANQLDVDLLEAVDEKMRENEQRFDDETVADINESLEKWQ